ncbi:MAG TPA: hypothetical protein VN774_02790 [Candidatus Limnocylindrales bacterium]|nr:hypothetical protein [Candidatus Limnocylindrales bacterium]
MAKPNDSNPIQPEAAPCSAFAKELAAVSPDSLSALLSDSRLDETHLYLLLERKDLPGTFLQEVAKRRDLLRSYQIKRSVTFHPHVPRLTALRLVRELYLMDLVKLSQSPLTAGDLQRVAEEQVISRLAQLPLGEKIALAKQASARVLGALISEGHARVSAPALNNPRLTEAQVLKVLTKEKLTADLLASLGRHPRWSVLPNVRLALLRHPHAPLELAPKLLSHLNLADLQALVKLKTISTAIRRHIEHEISCRMSDARGNPVKDPPQE